MGMINIDVSAIAELMDQTYGFAEALEKGDFQKRATMALAEIGRESFYRFADSVAQEEPSRLHHMYEWGMIGIPEGRLFAVWFPAIAHNQGYIVADARFEQSKLPVTEIGKTAQSLDSRKPRVFANKAEFLETGPHALHITPSAPGGVIAFLDEGGEMIFRPSTKPTVGQATSGQFAQLWNEYWAGAGSKEVEEKVAEPMRSFVKHDVEKLYEAALRRAKSSTSGMLSKGKVSGQTRTVTYWDRGKYYRPGSVKADTKKFHQGLRTVYSQWNRLSGR